MRTKKAEKEALSQVTENLKDRLCQYMERMAKFTDGLAEGNIKSRVSWQATDAIAAEFMARAVRDLLHWFNGSSEYTISSLEVTVENAHKVLEEANLRMAADVMRGCWRHNSTSAIDNAINEIEAHARLSLIEDIKWTLGIIEYAESKEEN